MLEIIFQGAEHEMVTVYHADGDEVVLTHYCVLGNQPHMKARPGGDGKQIVFECVGGTNLASERDKHMHQGTCHTLTSHVHTEDREPFGTSRTA